MRRIIFPAILALFLFGCGEEATQGEGEPVEPDVIDTPVDGDPNVEEVEPEATPDTPTPPPGAVDPGDVIDTGPGQEPGGGGGAN